MSSSRGRGGNFARRGGGGGSFALKGTFVNGVWHCDCNPPLPAVHFQVKKEGHNKGRWFRCCQKPQEERCRFFLWDSDAHPRENAALASSSRTEPGHAAVTTPRAQRVASPPPPYTPEARPSENNRKRARAAVQEDEDEFDFGDGNEAFQEELDQVMAAVETPSKKPRTDTFATPSHPSRRRLPWLKDDYPKSSALPTPQTEQRISSDLFPTPPRHLGASGRSLLTPERHPSSDDSGTMMPGSPPNETPTPARFRDVSQIDLVRDVFGVLRDANVQMNEQTRKNLTAVLSRHATIAEGVKKGREVARASIAAKTAKATELTYRVSTLEAELEAEKAKVNHLQWNLEHGQQSD